jgi:3alpha(or 20beta)-hydroxysteroid dehydrogenase
MTRTPEPRPAAEPFVDLQGKVALLTGAGGGLGSSEARLFVRCGALVMLTDVDEKAVRDLADEIGPNAAFEVLDVRDQEGWCHAVDATVKTFGRLDALVNNAGVYLVGGIQDLDLTSAREVLDTNLFGAMLGLHASVHEMSDHGGSIVLISSVAGVQGHSQAVAYCASKWALRGTCRSAAVELAPLGIRVNCICPGGVDTEMARLAARRHAERGTDLGVIAQPIPRLADPIEIAMIAAFLISDAASYCTGSDFVVDGGATAGL